MGLFNSTVLDWIIGIVFVYLLLAIICTTINEWIAGITGVRAKTLRKGIEQLLDQQDNGQGTGSFLKSFYAHPLVAGMVPPGATGADNHPSYLSARTFATAVMDLTTKSTPGAITFEQLQNGAKNLPDGDVKTALLALLTNAAGDLQKAQLNIEHWFDDSMERVSGWYKRRTQIVTVVVAAFLTIFTNADTIRMGHILWTDPTLRATILEKAKNRTDTGKESASRGVSAEYPDKDDPLKPEFKTSKDELDSLKPLLGWYGLRWNDPVEWLLRLLGWFLSITAISLGAPFWFDTLNKFMNIRNAGKKPDKAGTNNGRQTQPAEAGEHK